MSAYSIDLSHAEQALPEFTQTKKEKCASFDDIIRYVGITTSIGGIIGCLSYNLPAGAGVFGATGILFLIGHVTDKTCCGAKAKIIRIANARIRGYNEAIQNSEKLTQDLHNLTLKWDDLNARFETEQQDLTQQIQELTQVRDALQETLQRIKQENEKLQATSTALEEKIQAQEVDTRKLNEEIKKFTAQNQAFHTELQKIMTQLPKIKKVTGKMSRIASHTKLQLQKNITAFEQQMEQFALINQSIELMSAENENLKETIGELRTQTSAIHTSTDTIELHLKTIKELQETELKIHQEMTNFTRERADEKAAPLADREVNESTKLLSDQGEPL